MTKKLSPSSWFKKFRISQRQVGDISSQAEESIENLFFKRFERLLPVRRFILGWTGLILLLIALLVLQNFNLSNYFQTLKFVPGGIYSEGVEGSFTNANPIYSVSDADNTVSKLVFAGLFQYNDDGKLVGDLADGYTVGGRGNIYTVHLKPHLFWQDGQPLTAKDVVYTFNTIEDPDTNSPLFSNWQDIKVSEVNDTTVQFTLPDILASFPNNLTTGIIPQHILGKIPDGDLRSAAFNSIHPVGAGPFSWGNINVSNGENPNQEVVQIGLNPFNKYVNGQPKLDKMFVDIYANQSMLFSDFKNKQLSAIEPTNAPPKNITNEKSVITHNLILRAASMVFFKTSTGVLSDTSVRQALVQGADQRDIISKLGYPTLPVNEPLLTGQLAYNPSYAQSGYNPNAAKQLLEADGWTTIKDGIRYKYNKPLTFTLVSSDSSEDKMVTSNLKQEWQAIGVRLDVQYLAPLDFQEALSYHVYDAILTSITIGTDPDVFVYWDSSQADVRSTNRLNLSEYKNDTVDTAVESGRTRLDPTERVIKYQPFLQQWQKDAPALGLYQPRLLYLTNGPVGGLTNQSLNTATDRFSNVQNWEVRETKVTTN
jgi:peptide/nickel transport system substrate-binding protein